MDLRTIPRRFYRVYMSNKLTLVVALALVVGCGTEDKTAPPPKPGSGSASGEGDAASFVQTARTALVGHPAPAVTLELLDGSRIELAHLLGKRPIYLKF